MGASEVPGTSCGNEQILYFLWRLLKPGSFITQQQSPRGLNRGTAGGGGWDLTGSWDYSGSGSKEVELPQTAFWKCGVCGGGEGDGWVGEEDSLSEPKRRVVLWAWKPKKYLRWRETNRRRVLLSPSLPPSRDKTLLLGRKFYCSGWLNNSALS